MSTYKGMFRLYPIAGASEDGFVSTDKDIIKRSILNIIKTHKGSRVYDANYGTNLHRLIHEQNIQRTRNIAKAEIKEAIEKYEPRAKLLEVEAYAGQNELVSEVVVTLKVEYVEYGETEELEIRMAKEEEWVSEEGKPIDPIADWFDSKS